jgi:transcriptional regulator with XRE-family HTH domain
MTTNPEELGAEIKAAREQAGISGRAAAEAAGIHESRLRQIEKGFESRGDFQIPVKTTPKTLRGLLHVLGEHAGPLLREAVGPVVTPPVDPHPVGLGLDAEADGLTEDQVDAVRAVIRGMKPRPEASE